MSLRARAAGDRRGGVGVGHDGRDVQQLMVVNWLAAPPENHSYYAMIMAMGSLATAYCLSSTRFAALLNLGIGMVPIAYLMLDLWATAPR